MSQTKATKHHESPIPPAWPARPAAARLRRARPRPILARPPVRAIQACTRLQSNGAAITNLLAWRTKNRYELKMNTGWF